MPIPIVIAGIALFGGGAAVGYFSRNNEVERYKKIIKNLQDEVRSLHSVIHDQQEQLNIIKKKYEAVHKLNLIKKYKYEQQIKSILLESYVNKERYHLFLKQHSGNELESNEKDFVFLISKNDRNIEDTEKILLYIDKKYKKEINSQIYPDKALKKDMETISQISLEG